MERSGFTFPAFAFVQTFKYEKDMLKKEVEGRVPPGNVTAFRNAFADVDRAFDDLDAAYG